MQLVEMPRIPGLPEGWKPVKLARSKLHPRHATVLCQRTTDDVADQDFVCWNVNMVEGGCHNGDYGTRSYAALSYSNRKDRLAEPVEYLP